MKTLNINKKHPEDVIHRVKQFINELQKVQESYFQDLVNDLNINKEGEDWLFDYIYNSDDEYDGFDHYLMGFEKNYESMVNPKTTIDSEEIGLNSISILDNNNG